MNVHHHTGRKSGTSSVASVSLSLAFALLVAFGLAASWAIDRIDTRELLEEQRTVAAELDARRQRIGQEQDSSAIWDEAVTNLRADNQPWIAANLVDWMSDFFDHDRVYVIAPDDRVVRAASRGQAMEPAISPSDHSVVEQVVRVLRDKIHRASEAGRDSMPSDIGVGLADVARVGPGELAFVSVRPIVPNSAAVHQQTGSEFLHVSVVLFGDGLLEKIGEQVGLKDLRVGGPTKGLASLPIVNSDGRTVGFVVWTPRKPAMGLIKETAPATLSLLALGGLSIACLLIWLRRTTTKLEDSQARIEFLAHHDPLTGVANRALFEVQLQDALRYEHLAKTRVALIMIDLDAFKEINDTLGHAAGDQLIKQAARRLNGALSEGATLTRLGGDEFAVLHPGLVSEGHARFLCQSLLDSLQDPYLHANGVVQVTASLGVALEAGDTVSAEEMLHRADIALYSAKAAGRNCFQLYDAEMDQHRREARALEVDLRDALITGTGLYLLYQPIYDTKNSSIIGAEALVRWSHPTRGSLPPDRFIGVAEDRGLIDQLGLWVLDEACQFAAGSGIPWIAVNVSPIQLQDIGFADRVFATLMRYSLAPERLELEITEGVLLENTSSIQQVLAKLRSAGIRIALDDFGTGYSSISHLQHHQIDKLKIDQSFTRRMAQDKATSTIIRSVIEMAQALGMSVTAEGVEDDLQLQRLKGLGCQSVQGYFLSRPVKGDQMIELITRGESDTKTGAVQRQLSGFH